GHSAITSYSASRLTEAPYRLCASATTRLSWAVRCRRRTGEITMTCPSVDTSSDVLASIPTRSRSGLSRTSARLFPVFVNFFRMLEPSVRTVCQHCKYGSNLDSSFEAPARHDPRPPPRQLEC